MKVMYKFSLDADAGGLVGPKELEVTLLCADLEHKLMHKIETIKCRLQQHPKYPKFRTKFMKKDFWHWRKMDNEFAEWALGLEKYDKLLNVLSWLDSYQRQETFSPSVLIAARINEARQNNIKELTLILEKESIPTKRNLEWLQHIMTRADELEEKVIEAVENYELPVKKPGVLKQFFS